MELPELNSLLSELMTVTDFEQVIRNPYFWKLLYRLRNKELKDHFQSCLLDFYKCKTCSLTLRRFPNGGSFCLRCRTTSPGVEMNPKEIEKFQCLKCFRLYHYSRFLQQCYHICGFCISKELRKGKTTCKICSADYRAIHQFACSQCNNSLDFKDIFELRCGHTFCSTCIQKVKTEKRCTQCNGLNILVSEMYQINTRNQELCIICETNQTIEKFPRRNCCDLDICENCLQSSDGQCPGCEFSPMSSI